MRQNDFVLAFFYRPDRFGGNDFWRHRTVGLPVFTSLVLDCTIEKLTVGRAGTDQ